MLDRVEVVATFSFGSYAPVIVTGNCTVLLVGSASVFAVVTVAVLTKVVPSRLISGATCKYTVR